MKKVFQARHAMKDWNEPIYKYAVVDIGANSVRMNLYDIDTRTVRSQFLRPRAVC